MATAAATAAAKKKAAASKNATMEGQYGFVEDLVSSIPELAALVKAASAQGATPDAFSAMLQNTKWWKTNSNTARQMIALKASDPTTYNQQITNATSHVQQLAGQLGITLTAAQLKQYATSDLYQGLDDATLRSQLGSNFTAQAGGTAPQTGDVASYSQQLSALANAYGVPVTSSWVNQFVQSALTTGQSPDEMLAGARASLVNSATSAYPAIASQLQAGQTTMDIAQPYIAAMSQTLELPDSTIQLNDPTIQKALTNTALTPGAKPGAATPTAPGTPSTAGSTTAPGATSMPLWQFQDQLRQDARWQQTDNAKQSAYSMVASLGKQWGFAS